MVVVLERVGLGKHQRADKDCSAPPGLTPPLQRGELRPRRRNWNRRLPHLGLSSFSIPAFLGEAPPPPGLCPGVSNSLLGKPRVRSSLLPLSPGLWPLGLRLGRQRDGTEHAGGCGPEAGVCRTDCRARMPQFMTGSDAGLASWRWRPVSERRFKSQLLCFQACCRPLPPV